MSTMRCGVHVLFAGLFCCVFAAGCVERKERLNISPNGSVHYIVQHKSDSENDLFEGDAVPRAIGGWIASQEIERDENGKETYLLKAEALFVPGAKLPSNFAFRTDADADLNLQFPTSVTIEERRDGTYYHFARAYLPRPWAQIQALEERHVQGPLKDLAEIDPEQWTPAQREFAVRALATFETEKMLVFARSAFLHTTPDAPQDGWLAVQHQLRAALNNLDYRVLAKLLEPREATEDEKARDEAIQAELNGFETSLTDQLKQALFTEANYNGSQFNSFMLEYDRRKKHQQISEDLGDDKFEITVEMPGLVVASNADEVAGGTAKWTFDGGIVRDRELELLVTSRVSK
jgi:hypothetical protein